MSEEEEREAFYKTAGVYETADTGHLEHFRAAWANHVEETRVYLAQNGVFKQVYNRDTQQYVLQEVFKLEQTCHDPAGAMNRYLRAGMRPCVAYARACGDLEPLYQWDDRMAKRKEVEESVEQFNFWYGNDFKALQISKGGDDAS